MNKFLLVFKFTKLYNVIGLGESKETLWCHRNVQMEDMMPTQPVKAPVPELNSVPITILPKVGKQPDLISLAVEKAKQQQPGMYAPKRLDLAAGTGGMSRISPSETFPMLTHFGGALNRLV